MCDEGINQNVKGNGNTLVAGNQMISVSKLTSKLPSVLGQMLPALGKVMYNPGSTAPYVSPEVPYTIEDKINHNNLKTYRSWVDEYGEYGKTVDSIYEAIDDTKAGSRKKAFLYLSTKYLEVKTRVLREVRDQGVVGEDIEIIRQKADLIFEEVVNALKVQLAEADLSGIDVEDFDIGVNVIVCHAFINCRVLEKVPER